MKVIVGSLNPVKIKAAKEAFSRYFQNVEVIGVKVKSGVSEQPIGDETFRGAENRALRLKELVQNPNAHFFVGLEGGVIKLYINGSLLGLAA